MALLGVRACKALACGKARAMEPNDSSGQSQVWLGQIHPNYIALNSIWRLPGEMMDGKAGPRSCGTGHVLAPDDSSGQNQVWLGQLPPNDISLKSLC